MSRCRKCTLAQFCERMLSVCVVVAACGARAQSVDGGVADGERSGDSSVEPDSEASDAGVDDDAAAEQRDASPPDAGSADAAMEPDARAGSPDADSGAIPAEGSVPSHDASALTPVEGAVLAVPPAVAAEAVPAETPQSAPFAPTSVDVTVRSRASAAQRLQESAEAVNVVSMRRAKQQTADLGEVLARTQGINVRRQGGLGTDSRISLNGLTGDQIRYFVDGVPMATAGYPFGLPNVPINLIDRIEIYRGVVPVRFGVDALGGVVNVVTDQKYDTHLGASYQAGSYGLHRATLSGRYRHEPTGLVAGAALYLDVAENDYMMKRRPIVAEDGSAEYRTLPRFHDAYLAYGGNVEVGVVDKRWARKLIVKGFFGTYDKEIQHNLVMSIPYGEVTRGESVYGGTASYEVELSPAVELNAVFNYSHSRLDWRDMATHHYRWTGEQGRMVGRERAPGEPARGEIYGVAIDQSLLQDTFFGRAGLAWTMVPGHILRFSATPQLVDRVGDDHVPNRVDTLRDEKQATKQVVAGAEYELNLFADSLSNIAFAKLYYLRADYEGLTERSALQVRYKLDRDMLHYGGGDSMRYRFTDWLMGKVSYEYAIRLPSIEELFGNGVLIESNAQLDPERSHNINVGPRVDTRAMRYGSLTLDVNVFVRKTKDQIVLLATTRGTPYANLLDVSSTGIETGMSWESPGRYVAIDGSLTYQEIRNKSTKGVFEATNGRRVPNRPWLFGGVGLRGRAPDLWLERDALEPYFYSRYTHKYDRGWALGDPEYSLSIPSQWSHSVGITYSISRSFGNVACTIEVDNFMNEPLYDVYGVQRPGRSFNFKIGGEI